jgi:hypothetical protein
MTEIIIDELHAEVLVCAMHGKTRTCCGAEDLFAYTTMTTKS